MKNLREAEDIDFAFTSSSLNKAYQMSYNHALQMIERNGGYVDDSTVTIVCQKPEPVRLEKAFEGMYPIMRKNLNRMVEEFDEFEFEGTGFVMRGSVKSKDDDYVAYVSVYLDGELVEEAKLPANFTKRRQELCWRYQLPKGRHILALKWNNPTTDATVHCGEVIVYSDTPIQLNHQ